MSSLKLPINRQAHLKEEPNIRYNNSKCSLADKEFKCEYCENVLKSKASLPRHLNLYTSKKTFECDKCPMKFQTYSRLRYHKFTNHATTKQKCELCDKLFSRPQGLKRHLKTHQERDRSFKCDVCLRSYINVDHLRRHLKSALHGIMVKIQPLHGIMVANIVRKVLYQFLIVVDMRKVTLVKNLLFVNIVNKGFLYDKI